MIRAGAVLTLAYLSVVVLAVIVVAVMHYGLILLEVPLWFVFVTVHGLFQIVFGIR